MIINKIYSYFLTVCVILSIVTLCFKEHFDFFDIIEYATCTVFILDYIIQYVCAICKDIKNIYKYIFTFNSIIDILSIIPVIGCVSNTFSMFKVYRLFRIFKVVNQYKPLRVIYTVICSQKSMLKTIFIVIGFYIFVIALIMFNIEDESANFKNFFDALYWAVCTLTIVGYGDICPISYIGKIISMISSMLCIGLVALPSSILSAAYLSEIDNK